MRLMGPHPIAELTFTDCRIPAGNLLGKPGKGMEVALSTLDDIRMSVGASTPSEFRGGAGGSHCLFQEKGCLRKAHRR